MTGRTPTGMIDFDTARPGSRLWDLTYSVWTWLDFGEPRWAAWTRECMNWTLDNVTTLFHPDGLT